MKRSILGLIMLLVLLTAGIFTTSYMQSCHEGVLRPLEVAAEAAEAGNWQQAEDALRTAEEMWEQKWGITAALSDHEPMEKINDLFAQLEVYAQAQDSFAFRAVCARLGKALDAIGEAHSVAWWNLA